MSTARSVQETGALLAAAWGVARRYPRGVLWVVGAGLVYLLLRADTTRNAGAVSRS